MFVDSVVKLTKSKELELIKKLICFGRTIPLKEANVDIDPSV